METSKFYRAICKDHKLVLILPMRNGNLSRSKFFNIAASVLILPMRNGNRVLIRIM